MELRKIVGRVTKEECDEILALYERKNGLTELAKIMDAKNANMYERMVKDLGETTTKFQQWWDATGKKYGWEGHPKGSWEINFQTREITLVVSEA